MTGGPEPLMWVEGTPEQRAAAKLRRERERAEKLAAAQADWQVVRDRLAGNAVALAVLDIHKPEISQALIAVHSVQCAHPVDGYDAEPDEWPCSTFVAIKEA